MKGLRKSKEELGEDETKSANAAISFENGGNKKSERLCESQQDLLAEGRYFQNRKGKHGPACMSQWLSLNL